MKNGGENVIIQKSGHHRNLPRRVGPPPGGKTAAALAAFDEALLRKQGQRMAHRLAAEVVPVRKFLLGGQFITVRAFAQQFLAQGLCQELIFRAHSCIPFPGRGVPKLYY